MQHVSMLKHTKNFSSVFGGHFIVKNITCREEERDLTPSPLRVGGI